MDADELEDYLELRHPKVQANIATVRGEYQAGKGRPSIGLLDELKAASKRSRKQPARSKKP